MHGPCTARSPCRSQASRAQPGTRGLIPIPYDMCVHAEQRTFGAGSVTGRRLRAAAREQEMSCHTSAGAASSMMRRACTDRAMKCLPI